MKISKCDLSVRAYNSLLRAGIQDTKQLAKKTDYDLANIRGLGKKGLLEVMCLRDKSIVMEVN